jgi:hypothetical protein
MLNEAGGFEGAAAIDIDFSLMKRNFNRMAKSSLYFLVDGSGIVIITNIIVAKADGFIRIYDSNYTGFNKSDW